MPTPPVLLANRLEPFGAAGQEFDEGLQVLDFGNRHRLHEVGDGGETTRFAVLAEDLKFAPRRRLECGGLIELELEGTREFHELLVLAAVGAFRVWFAVGQIRISPVKLAPVAPCIAKTHGARIRWSGDCLRQNWRQPFQPPRPPSPPLLRIPMSNVLQEEVTEPSIGKPNLGSAFNRADILLKEKNCGCGAIPADAINFCKRKKPCIGQELLQFRYFHLLHRTQRLVIYPFSFLPQF